MKATNTISLTKAQDWAARWRMDPNNTVKAYLIPKEDITQLMNETDVQDVRAYMGIDEKGEHKLMLVGVDAKNKDLINEASGWYVYDFTTPCPNYCDTTSPLYTL